MKSLTRCLEEIDEGFIANMRRKPNYIQKIKLPLFKSFKKGTIVNFGYPISVLVGKNGSGKSSFLHALYGCPSHSNTGEYWFSTPLDPIDDPEDKDTTALRNSHIHYWKKEGQEVRCLQVRIFSKKKYGMEGWETSRHVKKYGFDTIGKRGTPVKKRTLYLDFRYLISSFDHYFYIGHKRKDIKSKKQAYLRRQSAILLHKIFPKRKRERKYKHYTVKKINITGESLERINDILGKNYTSGKILEHKCYGRLPGFSVYFKTPHISYSEAQAGSGETMMAKAVHELINAQKESLILLDEPDFSLHPSAQKKFLNFLLEIVISKKHQIVFTTHSPEMITYLPKTAVKLFHCDQNYKIDVEENVDSNKAFLELGAEPSKINIYVEDVVSKALIDSILKKIGKPHSETIKTNISYSGYEALMRHCIDCSQSENNRNIFFIGDGDQKREKTDFAKIPSGNMNREHLKAQFKKLTNRFPPLNENCPEENYILYCKNFFKFFFNHFHWLEKKTPEDYV